MEPLQAELRPDGTVAGLLWRGRRYRAVAVLDKWRWRGEWWRTPGLVGHRRRYYRLSVQDAANRQQAVWEVFQDRSGWTLSRELD